MAGQGHRHPARRADRGLDLRDDRQGAGRNRRLSPGLPPGVCRRRRQQRPAVLPAGARTGEGSSEPRAAGRRAGAAQLRALRARLFLVGRLWRVHRTHGVSEPSGGRAGAAQRQHRAKRRGRRRADRRADLHRHVGAGLSRQPGAGGAAGARGGQRDARRQRGLRRRLRCGVHQPGVRPRPDRRDPRRSAPVYSGGLRVCARRPRGHGLPRRACGRGLARVLPVRPRPLRLRPAIPARATSSRTPRS